MDGHTDHLMHGKNWSRPLFSTLAAENKGMSMLILDT